MCHIDADSVGGAAAVAEEQLELPGSDQPIPTFAYGYQPGRPDPTVVIIHDVNGANTPLTKTVGHGKALFFRDGQEFTGTWSRAKASQPTQYKFDDGTPAVFAGGQIWVTLLGRGRPVVVKP